MHLHVRTSSMRLQVSLCCLVLVLAFPGLSPLPAQTLTPDECPLVTRLPQQRVLLVMDEGEARLAAETCRQVRLNCERGSFADERDLSAYHLIVVGSNNMDYWGRTAELKLPEAFAAFEAFVRRGGHLLVANTYNGRNMQHLQRFGVQTGFNHNDRYRPVPGLTDVLFAGSEGLVPEGDFLKSSGNFGVDAPHVVLLARGSGLRAGHPCVATIPVDAGRVTYTCVEPSYGNPRGHWLIQVLIRWAARGAPIAPGPTDPIVTDRRPRVPSDDALAAAAQSVSASFGADPDAGNAQAWGARADVYASAAVDEQDAAVRYHLLQQAAESFARAGESEAAVAALDRWTTDFAVPRHQAALSTLQLLEKSATTGDWQEQVRGLGLASIDEALQARDIDSARALLELATKAAEASKNRRTIALCKAEAEYVDRVAQAADAVEPWFDRLRSEPSNAEAARRAGLFQACVLRDWDRGLAWLTQGDDELLRTAGELDLAAPVGAEERVTVAEAWIEAARAAPESERPALEQRAAHWFALALPDLTGLRRASVEQKLQRVGGPAFSLRIVISRASGELRLELSPDQILCQNESTKSLPDRITLGDLGWTPDPSGRLPNAGHQRVLPRDVHLSSARLGRLRTKGTISLESATEEQVVLRLAHEGTVLLPHEVTLEFGAP